jgi:pimeloyl-ACP methyl ester carboxylesterase
VVLKNDVPAIIRHQVQLLLQIAHVASGVPPHVQAKIGHYPEPGGLAARAIAHATLIEFPEDGHAPQMQDPRAFHTALLNGFSALSDIP